jgi:nitroreductase
MDRRDVIALMGLPQGLAETENTFSLPAPRLDGPVSMERALQLRRSVRSYSHAALSLEETAQLLWAAQGVTSRSGYRTAPGAGALYPLETILCAGRAGTLRPGVYKYCPAPHDLILLADGDRRAELAETALGQAWIR